MANFMVELFLPDGVVRGLYSSRRKAQLAANKIRKVSLSSDLNERRVVIKHDAGVIDIDVPFRGVSYVGVVDVDSWDAFKKRGGDNA